MSFSFSVLKNSFRIILLEFGCAKQSRAGSWLDNRPREGWTAAALDIRLHNILPFSNQTLMLHQCVRKFRVAHNIWHSLVNKQVWHRVSCPNYIPSNYKMYWQLVYKLLLLLQNIITFWFETNLVSSFRQYTHTHTEVHIKQKLATFIVESNFFLFKSILLN